MDDQAAPPAHTFLRPDFWQRLSSALDAAVQRRGDAWVERGRAIAALGVLQDSAGRRDGAEPVAVLERIAHVFGLESFAADLLGLAVAVELDPAVYLLAGLLSGDASPGRPTAAVAAELCSIDVATDHRVARAVLPEGVAARWGLLRADGDGPFPGRRLRVGAAVVDEVRGIRQFPPQISGLVEATVTQPGAVADKVAAALQAGHDFLWVHSPAGGAGAAAALAACQQLSVPAFAFDLRRSPVLDQPVDPGAVRELVRTLLVQTALDGAIAVVVGADAVVAARDLLLAPPVPVIAVAAHAWKTPIGATIPVTITASPPTIAERERQWWPLLAGAHPDPAVVALRLTPEDIVRVARHARAQAELAGEPWPGTERILASARALVGGRADQDDRPAAGLDDLVLPDDVRAELDRLLAWTRLKDQVRPGGPLGQRGTGVCALFSGSPGTGKTLSAHVLADHLGMNLQQVELASIVDKYIGETEKNLERVFAQAEASNSLLFFDEADALFGSRSEVKDARDRYANQEVAYLLQRMEQFDGITILATNLRGNLDPAFSRRLQFIVHFPDPDEATRRRLWERHLDGIALDTEDPPDLAALAAGVELAGGDIRNIVLAAAVDAAASGHPLSMRMLTVAVARDFAKLGRRAPVITRR